MTIHKTLLQNDDRDRFYVSRKDRWRGLTNIEECVDATIQGLKYHTKMNKEIAAANKNSNKIKCKQENNKQNT